MSRPGAWFIPGDTRFRKHEHECGHICVVLDGGFVERDKYGWRDVAPGTVRVSGAAMHDIDFGTAGATCLVLEIDAPVRLPHSLTFFENDKALASVAFSIRNHVEYGDPLNRVRIDDLTTEFLAQVSRRLDGKTGRPPSWLTQLRDVIHDSNGRGSVESLARDAGVHRVHLARSFKEHYGVPVTRYIRSVRVQSALALIAAKRLSLSQVAAESGFADQSHLTREIRAAVGTTPGAVRSMLHAFKTD